MDLIIVTPEEKNQVRQLYNITSTQINEDIEIIKTWLSKQPHLPQNLSDDFIEKLLLRNKFRVERTKQKLDNYFTLRGNYRDFIENWQHFRPSKWITTFVPMPKLTSNLERIYIYKIQTSDPELFDMYQISRFCLAVKELALQHDYAIGIRIFCDLLNYKMEHLIKTNPIPITKLVKLLQGAYSSRIRGLEFVNFPTFVGKIMAIIKLAFPPKLYERITLHENMESVYQKIPKEILPIEYGGNSGSMKDLLNKWDEVFIENEKFFLENCKNVSREELRPPELNDDTFGVQGTFKKPLRIKLRQHYNVTSTQINKDIEIIKTWLSKQPHLPQNLSDDIIERFLLKNKFRVEKTKQKLDNYFTLRGKHKDFLENRQLFRPSQEISTHVPMPKLTPNHERIIYISHIRNPDTQFLSTYQFCKLALAFEELMLPYDYADGIRILADLNNYQLGHLPRTNPIPIAKLAFLIQGAYSARIRGFELVNLPPFIAKFMAIIKLALPQKLYERITLHENMESLYKVIPKENLPVEYGGTSGSMTDLLKKWDEVFIENEKFFLENSENVSREELRPPELNDDTFGVQGTFKKLAID